ncbi:MAG TPA: hypothetical protein VGD12_14030 [Blastococcus sp.]
MATRLPAVLRQIGSVAVGLAVLGLASFAFLSVSGRALGPAAFAPLATMWVILNATGPALFQPLEQEVGRAVAHRRALGQGSRPVYRKASILALGMIAVTGLVLALAGQALADEVFSGSWALVAALFVGVAGLGAEHLTRGALAGGDLYDRYGWQLALDGVLRLGGSVALAAAGVLMIGAYGFVLGLAPLVAVSLTMWRLGPATAPGPPAAWGDLTRAVGLLAAGSILAQVVINAAPVAATVLARPGEAARAGIFISVLVLARVPLFLFAAIQAAFLPGLAALAAQGDEASFRRRLTFIVGVVSALGLAGVLTIAAIGPWLVRLFYGAAFVTTRLDLVPLAAAAGFFMLASVFAQTMVSVRLYVPTLVGWAAGTAAFFLGLLAPMRLEQRVGLAFLAGCAVAALAMGLLLRQRYRDLFRAVEPGPTAVAAP